MKTSRLMFWTIAGFIIVLVIPFTLDLIRTISLH